MIRTLKTANPALARVLFDAITGMERAHQAMLPRPVFGGIRSPTPAEVLSRLTAGSGRILETRPDRLLGGGRRGIASLTQADLDQLMTPSLRKGAWEPGGIRVLYRYETREIWGFPETVPTVRVLIVDGRTMRDEDYKRAFRHSGYRLRDGVEVMDIEEDFPGFRASADSVHRPLLRFDLHELRPGILDIHSQMGDNIWAYDHRLWRDPALHDVLETLARGLGYRFVKICHATIQNAAFFLDRGHYFRHECDERAALSAYGYDAANIDRLWAQTITHWPGEPRGGQMDPHSDTVRFLFPEDESRFAKTWIRSYSGDKRIGFREQNQKKMAEALAAFMKLVRARPDLLDPKKD